jgi:DNA replication protein DnaC
MKLLKGFPKRYDDAPEATGDGWMAHCRQALTTIESGGIVVMYGTHGTGKTRMAWELAKKCNPKDAVANLGGVGWAGAQRERPAVYTTAVDLFRQIRGTFSRDSELSETQVIKMHTDAGLLVIDEMQERGKTEFEDRELTSIIDTRYAHERPTILITNHTREQLAASLSPAVLDRIRENGCGLYFNWTSYRKLCSI